METEKQILSFNCGDQVFGLDISYLREIIENQALTRIPLMPEHIRGVLNLRGNVVPVIDLMARLWGKAAPISKLSCILVVEFSGEERKETLGLFVDSVNEVLRVPAENIEHTPDLGARIRTDFMDGIARVDEEFIVLLKANMVLNLEELSRVHESLDLAGNDWGEDDGEATLENAPASSSALAGPASGDNS